LAWKKAGLVHLAVIAMTRYQQQKKKTKSFLREEILALTFYGYTMMKNTAKQLKTTILRRFGGSFLLRGRSND
jgi:hypothetical protein